MNQRIQALTKNIEYWESVAKEAEDAGDIDRAHGIRNGIARNQAELDVLEATQLTPEQQAIETQASKLEALAAKKKAQAAAQELDLDLDAATPEELLEAAAKLRAE